MSDRDETLAGLNKVSKEHTLVAACLTGNDLDHLYCACEDGSGNGEFATMEEFTAHVAAVVLAHLTAEGWAQGREEWGIQVHIASVAGRGTRVEPMDTEELARDPYRHVFVAHGETVERKVPVRRRVTDWAPVETGDQE